jgi:hypothetical protein
MYLSKHKQFKKVDAIMKKNAFCGLVVAFEAAARVAGSAPGAHGQNGDHEIGQQIRTDPLWTTFPIKSDWR